MIEFNIICPKDIQTPNNYNIWISEMQLLLQINGIDDYVIKDKLKIKFNSNIPYIKNQNHLKVIYFESLLKSLLQKQS